MNRTIINNYMVLRSDEGWLLLIHWGKNVSTSTHGHPESFFVYVLDGLMEIESFKVNPLQSMNKKTVQPGQYFYYDGLVNRFDNAVHRVHAKQQALSLHYYSDDPTKGNVYA